MVIQLNRKIRKYSHLIDVCGHVSLDMMPKAYSEMSVCVFPSVWENFPNVCLEAMSAGRAIVATYTGGMAEMLDNGEAGVMIPPRNPMAIADAVINLLRSPEKCLTMGNNARQKVLEKYSDEKVGALLEKSYEKAIMNKKCSQV